MWSTYQNHVLCNHILVLCCDWRKKYKNDKRTYKPDSFQLVQNTFFWIQASNECHVATGNCHPHYMDSGKKKPQTMSPQHFLTHFQKVLCNPNFWIVAMKKNLTTTKPIFSFLFLSSKYVYHMLIMIVIPKPWQCSIIFSKAITTITTPKHPIIVMTKAMPLIAQNFLSPTMIVVAMLQLPPPTSQSILLWSTMWCQPAISLQPLWFLQRYLCNQMGWLSDAQSCHWYPNYQRFWFVTQNCQPTQIMHHHFLVRLSFMYAAMPQSCLSCCLSCWW